MKTNKLLRKALEDDITDIAPVETRVTDAEVNIDETELAINQVETDVAESDEMTKAIEDAQDTEEVLQQIADIIDPEESKEPLVPQEAEIIDFVTEHLKTIVGLKTSKRTFPSMECFGSSMSMLDGTKLAVEGLTELVSEISTGISNALVMRFSDEIKDISNISEARVKLLADLRTTNAKAQEFFRSPKYQETSNLAGSPLLGGNYTKYLVRNVDLIENNMPIAALLSGITSFKLNYSTSAIVSKFDSANAIHDVFLNTEASRENLLDYVKSANDFMKVLVPAGENTESDSGYSLTTTVKLPISNYRLKFESNKPSETNYYYGEVVLDKFVHMDSNLLALSDQEATALLETAISMLESEEFITKYAENIEKVISVNKAIDGMKPEFLNTDAKDTDECNKDFGYRLMYLNRNMLTYGTKVAMIELRILKAINDYVLDSIGFMFNKTTAVVE